MRIQGKKLMSIFALVLLLTACASSKSSEKTQSVDKSVDQGLVSEEVWGITLVPVSEEYETATPVCDEPYGKFRDCEFRLEVTNISKLPQTLEGIFYLETSDGTVYQEQKRWSESPSQVINPGDTAVQWASFALPFQGELIARMYRAWGATAEPIFSHTFNPMWEMAYD